MTNTNTSLITPLPDWSLIRVSGPDAGSFLHNLLTNNISSLKTGEHHLSGFCSPKGRLLASFWVSHPQSDVYELWISTDLASEFTKKLAMYRLRSKVDITLVVVKVYGQYSETSIAPIEGSIQLPAVSFNNRLYQRQIFASEEIIPGADHSLWNILEVQSGIPRITQATKDLFVPQMVNFESVGGIDFKKGCYPGQEVVARSQYLGTIKRRLKIGSIHINQNQAQHIGPGTEIFSVKDPEQSCGIVILMSENPINKRYDFQVEMKLNEIGDQIYFQALKDENNWITIEEPPYQLINI
jgi:folate-binding protein YgfZ